VAGGHVQVTDYGMYNTAMGHFNAGQEKLFEPESMPPEVLTSGAIVNGKACDVYSFGILLLELITRQDPYGNMSAMQIGLKVRFMIAFRAHVSGGIRGTQAFHS
jgi:serine/threonine protein kinase